MSGFTFGLNLTNKNCPTSFPCGNMLGCGVSSLGCGVQGWSAKPIGSQSQTGPVTQSVRGADRAFLRRGFGTNRWRYERSPTFCSGPWRGTGECSSYIIVGRSSSSDRVFMNQTPFRLSMLAGDPYGTINESPMASMKGPNQVARSGISYGVLPRSNGGSTRANGDAGWTGNSRWVYDGSDYARYKKLKAMSQNYNDSSFGGDQHNASQQAIAAARRGFSR